MISLEIDYKGIGQRIRNARKAKGKEYTQEYLANLVKISPSYMSAIENGSSKLALPTLIVIANALETTVDALLYDEKNKYNTDFLNNVKIISTNCNDKEKAYILRLIKTAADGFKDL